MLSGVGKGFWFLSYPLLSAHKPTHVRSEVSHPDARHRGPRHVDILYSLKSACGWKKVLVGVQMFLFWNCSCSLCRVLSVFGPLQNHRLVWSQRDSGLQVRGPASRLPVVLLGTGQGANVQMFQRCSLLHGWSPALHAVSQVPAAGQHWGRDVSLTILNAQWSDIVEYGCRVEAPGWFNDHEVNIWLLIEEG